MNIIDILNDVTPHFPLRDNERKWGLISQLLPIAIKEGFNQTTTMRMFRTAGFKFTNSLFASAYKDAENSMRFYGNLEQFGENTLIKESNLRLASKSFAGDYSFTIRKTFYDPYVRQEIESYFTLRMYEDEIPEFSGTDFVGSPNDIYDLMDNLMENGLLGSGLDGNLELIQGTINPFTVQRRYAA